MMLLKRLVFLVTALLLFSYGYSVKQLPGSQYTYDGYGAKEISLGNTGISEMGDIDGNSFNPAALGDTRRMANSLTIGGFGSPDLMTALGFALPTGFGVFSINGIFSGASGTNSLNSLWGAQINLAKPITENLFWGAGISFRTASALSKSDWQAGLDMGMIYTDPSDKKGFGYLDPSYGIVLKNIGKTVSISNYDAFPAMGLGVGASFYPVKLDIYKLKVLGDLSLPFNPFNFLFNVGVENILFDFLKIRLGYMLNSSSLGITSVGPLNFGIGLTGKVKVDPKNVKQETIQVKGAGERLENSTDIDISYALQNQQFNGKNEFAHFVSVNVAWGFYNEQKPDIKIVPDHAYFSPNFDGTQDTVKLALNIHANALVYGWVVNVMDKDKKVVKTYKSMDKLQIQNLTFPKALEQIFSSKQQVEIPKEVEWDGQDENGLRLPDGDYTYVLRAWDENKNTAESEPSYIHIDTVVPKMETAVESAIFSPNNDGAKDTISFSVKSQDILAYDKVTATVRDASGNAVKNYSYDGKVPDKVVWDGNDNNSKPVPEGDYTFNILVSNEAGNKAENTIAGIHLVRAYQSVEISPSADAFSPGSAGAENQVVFRQKVSDGKGLDKWSLKVYDSGSKAVKEFKGEKSLPEEIVWDGKDNSSKVLPDGIYGYDLQLNYDSGNFPKTGKKNIKIDTTAPMVTIKPEYTAFSPNGDGKQDTVTFTQTVKGEDDDILEAKISDNSGTIYYYNKYSLKDFPKSFTWNGLDKDLKPLPEGKYAYIIDGTDRVGNKSSFSVKDIVLKTGLEKVAVQSDVPALSPGHEGAVQKAVFTSTVTSRDGIVSFSLEIASESGTVVKKFVNSQFADKIEWDGKDENGKAVSDGNYSYRLKLKYSFGDEPVSALKTIRVDTAAPDITVSADSTIFSPNGDGRKETLPVKQAVKGDPGDQYEAGIIDSSGRAVRTYQWTGTVPDELVWDGRDDKGNPAAEGRYTYMITGTDSAKNKAVKTIPGIKLVRAFETLAFSSDVNAFAPGGTGKPDTIQFTQALSSTNDLLGSGLFIMDRAGKAVRKILKKEDMDKTIVWEGKTDSGTPAADGNYSAQMLCEFASGNLISAVISNITLDRTPPDYKLTMSPDLFTPDGDGDGDILYMNLDLTDMSGVKNWDISIYKKQEKGESGPLFRKFSGTGNTKQLIQWDGMSDDKQDLVEAVQDYTAVLTADDMLGNTLTVQKVIPVGVLVEKTPEGLRIRVSSIQFGFDRSDLVGNSAQNIDKVIYIIRKILSDPKKYDITENYKIEVSGHTDDVPGPTPDYNQKLSERRARTVYNYLQDKDINKKILTSVGYGETRPYKIIKPGMTKEKIDEYRARNRRVEFFIRK
jgi:flagellar hook assembly protein FlgD/outer membrane protein OmpA-like peptidoglycan-associated protein